MRHKSIIYNKPTRCNTSPNSASAQPTLNNLKIDLYRIYSVPTHDKHQWLLLQFIVLLMMDTKGVRNMYSIPAVVNKHSTARVASFWFILLLLQSALQLLWVLVSSTIVEYSQQEDFYRVPLPAARQTPKLENQ